MKTCNLKTRTKSHQIFRTSLINAGQDNNLTVRFGGLFFFFFSATKMKVGLVYDNNRVRRQSGFPTFISCQRQDANVLPKRRQSHQGDKLCDVSTVPLVARWPVFLARGPDADGEPHYCTCTLRTPRSNCSSPTAQLGTVHGETTVCLRERSGIGLVKLHVPQVNACVSLRRLVYCETLSVRGHIAHIYKTLVSVRL